MIEVVFSDSTKGSMRYAKGHNKHLAHDDDQVVGISFYLDIGDISGGATSNARKELIFKMFRHPYEENEGDTTWKHEYWEGISQDFEKLKVCAQNGEHIRIWYSEAPYSICGFYFVNSILKDYDCKLSAVKLPQLEVKDNNTIISYSSWAEVDPGKFHDFLQLEKEISSTEKKFLASRWHELKMDNAPLRAVVNGKLVSVPEDFYDHFIRRSMLEGEFTVARLIGTVLGNHQLGIGDWLVAQRIDYMIACSELEVASDDRFGYGRALKKIYNQEI